MNGQGLMECCKSAEVGAVARCDVDCSQIVLQNRAPGTFVPGHTIGQGLRAGEVKYPYGGGSMEGTLFRNQERFSCDVW